ncbi:MAG: hypothetical protein ACK5C5_04180 [Bacteroidota bacterium]
MVLFIPVLLVFIPGDVSISMLHLAICTIVCILLALLFSMVRLELTITTDAIQYRLFPFQIRIRTILFNQLAEYRVRKYAPLLEYGGWGLRWGASGSAVTVKGRMGIQLVFKNGKRLLIGTSDAASASRILSQRQFISSP